MKRILARGDTLPLLLAADEEPALIGAARRSTARILRTLLAGQLQEQGVHSKCGLVPLVRVIQLAANHIPHHLPFIAAKKQALGIG
jgi:hypothetical protein